MRIALFVAITLTASVSGFAREIAITSPDHACTFAYGEMIWHQLYMERPSQQLLARITFSNLPYVSDHEPRTDEPFDFRFPLVHLDPASRVFFARDRRGEQVPIARSRADPVCGWIDLAPGAKIYLLKESGRVTAVLTATDYPRAGTRWIEMNNNLSLQNLLVGLLGRSVSRVSQVQ
jgi:hypothetical protein